MSLAEKTALSDTSLVHEAGAVRVRRCRYGLMAYIMHDAYIGRSFDLYGEFSAGEANVFSQLIRTGMTALDVGANIGAHTVLMARLVGPQGRVIAYEPQRVINQLLCANIAMNGFFNVQARLAAAGRTPGKLLVPLLNYNVGGNYGGLSLGSHDNGEEAPVETIDMLNLPACHFVKIDVEGMEEEAIAGAEHTIRRHRPLMYMENDRAEKSRPLIEAMFALDYRLFWHLTPYYSPSNWFKNPDNVFKGTLSVNMLAVPRERGLTINGMPEVTDSSQSWKEALENR
jgi:FkbM family methyltransferase